MKRSSSCLFLSLLLATAIGCGGTKKPVTPPSTVEPDRLASAPDERPRPRDDQSVAVAEDIAAACKLRFGDTEQAPKFGYDDAKLSSSEGDLLQHIAECVIRGPLQGKAVQLVGRADPRGTEEYNLGLGSRRAEQVRAFLQRLGVPAGQLQVTTRGAIDASGTEEMGWRKDRRVDIELGVQ